MKKVLGGGRKRWWEGDKDICPAPVGYSLNVCEIFYRYGHYSFCLLLEHYRLTASTKVTQLEAFVTIPQTHVPIP